MQNMRKERGRSAMKRQKGFTLVEIIVVLAIIAVLAAVTIPSIAGFLKKPRKQVCLVDRSMLEKEYYLATMTQYNSGKKDAYIAKIEEIFAAHGGVKSGTGYKGLSHYDECIYTYEIDDNGMISIDCSVHGEDSASAAVQQQKQNIKTLLECESVKEYLNRIKIRPGTTEIHLDSSGNQKGATAPIVWKELESFGIDPSAGGFKIYATVKNKEIVSQHAYWTSKDIRDSSMTGKTVSVTRYDALTGEYLTGTMKISTRTTDGIKYNALDEKSFKAD